MVSIKLSNVILSGIFKNIDFHRLYRGTVFQQKYLKIKGATFDSMLWMSKRIPQSQIPVSKPSPETKTKHNN